MTGSASNGFYPDVLVSGVGAGGAKFGLSPHPFASHLLHKALVCNLLPGNPWILGDTLVDLFSMT